MIDIHTHILPAIDDGAQTIQESVAMAQIAVDDGITHMIATPHHHYIKPHPRQYVTHRVTELQALLGAAFIPLTVIPGHEVHLHDNVLDDWDSGLAGPLGDSRYVLAEPLFHYYDLNTTAILFELFDRGFIPIIAHPERIGPIQDNLALIEPVLARGGLTQITANSLTHVRNWQARKTAEAMLRNGMVHIIASDAHRPNHRKPILSLARTVAAQIVGEAAATAMVTANPMAIINDEPIAVQAVAD